MQIPQDKPKSPFSKLILFISIGIFLVLALFLLWPTGNQATIQSAYVEEGNISEHIPLYGRLRAEVERSIIPKISGAVVNKLVRPGDLVTPDSVILELSNIKIEQEYTDAKMAVMSVLANMKELESQLLSQQRKLNNNVVLAKSKQALFEVELSAKKKLYVNQVISELDLKKAELEFQQAQLAAQLGIDELSDFSQIKEAKRAVENARLEQAKARLDVATSNKESLLIKAGMNGVVQSLDSTIKVGQWLNAGDSLGNVAQADKLYAEAKVMASYASMLEVGQHVTLEIKGETVNGVVNHIEPNVVENQVQLYIVPEALPNTARLNIELSGRITVIDKAALVVARPEYISDKKSDQAVWVIDSNGDVQMREAVLGLITQSQIEIISGLVPGDRVALSNVGYL